MRTNPDEAVVSGATPWQTGPTPEAGIPGFWALTQTVTRRLNAGQRRQLRAAMQPGWRGNAPCASADPDAWFPDKGQPAVPQVLAICAGCPVRRSCLASALLHGERGVWAGTTAAERGSAFRWLHQGQTVSSVLDRALDGGLPGQRRDRDRMWRDHPRGQYSGRAAA